MSEGCPQDSAPLSSQQEPPTAHFPAAHSPAAQSLAAHSPPSARSRSPSREVSIYYEIKYRQS